MKSREILLVVLVVAIALGSGLIGLYLGRSSVQQPAQQPEAAVGGRDVAAESTRLFTNPAETDLVFEFENGRVYEGTVQQGQAVLFFDGQSIFRGANSTGEKLFTVDGNRIFVGANTSGPLAYTIEGQRIHEGSDTGPVVYTIEGDRLYEGANTTGEVVFFANQPLSGDIQFLLPILADQRF